MDSLVIMVNMDVLCNVIQLHGNVILFPTDNENTIATSVSFFENDNLFHKVYAKKS